MSTGVEEYVSLIDIRDSYELTRVLDRKLPETSVYDVGFMPIKSFRGRRVELRVRETNGAGLAGFKAENTNAPIVKQGGVLQQIYMDLVTIAEEDTISAEQYMALASKDDGVRAGAARTMVEKAENLKRRNINRTRWMAWKAVQDALTIVYPSGVAIAVDWDLDGSDWNSHFTGSHLPTASVEWDHITDEEYDADIITDVYNWSKLIADDLGTDEGDAILHMNSTTWRYVRRNKYLLKESSPSYSQPRSAPLTLAEVASVLDVAEVKIVNAYYLDDTALRTKYKFLEDGKVLLTAPYTVEGTPIAEMYDGLVATIDGEDIKVANNPGMAAEMYTNKVTISKNVRVQTARMPILNYPAAFIFGTVAS